MLLRTQHIFFWLLCSPSTSLRSDRSRTGSLHLQHASPFYIITLIKQTHLAAHWNKSHNSEIGARANLIIKTPSRALKLVGKPTSVSLQGRSCLLLTPIQTRHVFDNKATSCRDMLREGAFISRNQNPQFTSKTRHPPLSLRNPICLFYYNICPP